MLIEPTDTGILMVVTDQCWSEIPGATELTVTMPKSTVEYIYHWADFTGFSLNSLIDWSVMSLDIVGFTVPAIKSKVRKTEEFHLDMAANGEDTQDFTIEGATADRLRAFANLTGWTLNMIVDYAVKSHAAHR
jgi:hypothetical protein